MPIRLSLLVAAAALCLPSLAAAQLAGPNTYGYTAETAALDYVDPPLGTLPLGDPLFGFGDDDEETVTLPWSFEYFGVDYTSVTVGANGGVAFVGTQVGFSNACLPATGSAPALMVLWDDLDPSALFLPIFEGVFAWHDTDGGNDRFVVAWHGIPHISAGDDVYVQVHLYPSGAIEYHYDDLDLGDPTYDDAASATIGLQDVSGATDLDPLEISCDTAEPTFEGSGISITSCTDGDGDGICAPADCDDTNIDIYPGAPETCGDGIDDDCDGADELIDDDADGYDDVACGGDDCDDDDDTVHPGVDEDSDGFSVCDDCNDSPGIGAFINPDADEVCDDGVDNDCDGIAAIGDEDGDTYDNALCGGDDCDDTDAAINPGVDGDGDGFDVCADCDDTLDTVNDDAEEICDTIDNNCDGVTDDVDEDEDGESPFECGGTDCDDSDPLLSPDYDGDADGVDSCADCDDDDDTIYPGATEACDGIDQDCDGAADGQDADVGGGSVPDEIAGPGPLVAIVDNETVTSVLNVAVGGVEVVDVDVLLEITHSWDGDLTVALTSPSGTEVELFSGVGGSSDNFTGTVLDDDAATAIGDGSAPFTGTFAPSGDLSAFEGEPTAGDWILSITDGASGDEGTLDEWSLDFDLDGLDSDGDGWVDNCADFGDCDTADATIYPGAPEICSDSIDQDCDGVDPTGDLDGDGYIDATCGGDDCDDGDFDVNPGIDADSDGSNACDDCDDDDPDNFPGNPETCDDGIDQNCSGEDDIGDQDGDGYINEACIGGDDCDDTDDFFNPGLDSDGDGSNYCEDCDDGDDLSSPDFEEICGDFLDNDCSGEVDDAEDADGDGVDSCDDCDDDDDTVFPGAPETCDDGVDQDCDGEDLLSDVDGDGYVNDNCGDEADDCDDEDPAFNPGADEACDGIDLNCDGETTSVDEDGDGYFDEACGGTDCDDAAQGIHPDIPELCNGVDDNCDGELHPEGEDDLDEDGIPVCDGDCDDTNADIGPDAPELCDEIDNDCDGEVDDGVIRDGDSDGHEREACGGDDCDDANSGVSPTSAEDCADGIDNDCDTLADADDEDCDFGSDGCEDCNSSMSAGSSASLAGLVAMVGLIGRRRRRVA